MLHFVYDEVDPQTDIPFYVGVTSNPNARHEQHLAANDPTNEARNERIKHLLSKDIVPKMRILEVLYSKKEAHKRERYWIQTYLIQGIQLTNILLITPSKPKAAPKVKAAPKPNKSIRTFLPYNKVPEHKQPMLQSLTEEALLMLRILRLFSPNTHTQDRVREKLTSLEHIEIAEQPIYSIQTLLDNLPYSLSEMSDIFQIPDYSMAKFADGKPTDKQRVERILLILSWIYKKEFSVENVTGFCIGQRLTATPLDPETSELHFTRFYQMLAEKAESTP